MANPANEDLDKDLRDSGFKKDSNDDYYYRDNGRGGLEKRYTDDNHSQSSENGGRWEKHSKGDQY